MPMKKKTKSTIRIGTSAKSDNSASGKSTAARKSNAPSKHKKTKPKRSAPAPIVSTGYWLLKSEPDAFSWDQLKSKGNKGEEWSGVRNYLARNNMRAMRLGDLGFFYHSNIGLEIVGICEVSALAHPDSTADDPKWECVDVRALRDVPRPVSLKDVKANPKLAHMSLVTSMRLSVQPVTKDEWDEVCRMGGVDAASRSKKRGHTGE